MSKSAEGEKKERSLAARTFDLWELDAAAPAEVRAYIEEQIAVLYRDMRSYLRVTSKRLRSV